MTESQWHSLPSVDFSTWGMVSPATVDREWTRSGDWTVGERFPDFAVKAIAIAIVSLSLSTLLFPRLFPSLSFRLLWLSIFCHSVRPSTIFLSAASTASNPSAMEPPPAPPLPLAPTLPSLSPSNPTPTSLPPSKLPRSSPPPIDPSVHSLIVPPRVGIHPSPVWQHFRVVAGDRAGVYKDFAFCLLCSTFRKRSGGSTQGMLRHLQSHHPTLWEEGEGKGEGKGEGEDVEEEVKSAPPPSKKRKRKTEIPSSLPREERKDPPPSLSSTSPSPPPPHPRSTPRSLGPLDDQQLRWALRQRYDPSNRSAFESPTSSSKKMWEDLIGRLRETWGVVTSQERVETQLEEVLREFQARKTLKIAGPSWPLSALMETLTQDDSPVGTEGASGSGSVDRGVEGRYAEEVGAMERDEMRSVVEFNRRLIHRMLIPSNWTRSYKDIIRDIEKELDGEGETG